MARYRTQVRSPWPRREAFDYLADLAHFADWDPGITASRLVDGTPGTLGSTYDVTVKGPVGSTVMRYEIVSVDRPVRVEARSTTATLTSVDVMEFADDGDGCVVTYDADVRLRGVLGLADPLFGLIFRRIGDRAAAGLRERLDGN